LGSAPSTTGSRTVEVRSGQRGGNRGGLGEADVLGVPLPGGHAGGDVQRPCGERERDDEQGRRVTGQRGGQLVTLPSEHRPAAQDGHPQPVCTRSGSDVGHARPDEHGVQAQLLGEGVGLAAAACGPRLLAWLLDDGEQVHSGAAGSWDLDGAAPAAGDAVLRVRR